MSTIIQAPESIYSGNKILLLWTSEELTNLTLSNVLHCQCNVKAENVITQHMNMYVIHTQNVHVNTSSSNGCLFTF